MNAPHLATSGPRVDFVIGGVQKGGTTALDRALRQHPGVSMATVKEPHRFDDERLHEGPAPDVTDYHALWNGNLGRRVCGEATPSYLWWPPAAPRIRAYNPAIKWVLLLRDPVSRAYSHWNMGKERRDRAPSFEAALDLEVRAQRNRPGLYRHRSGNSLERGLYAQHLERLYAIFPREQVLVLRSEWLRDEPAATLARVHAFLGVEPAGSMEVPVDAHVGRYDRPMDPATRAKLKAFFAGEIGRLEALLGWDLSDWRSG